MATPSGFIDITAIPTAFGSPYSMIALTGKSFYDSSNNAYRVPNTIISPGIYNSIPNNTFTLPTGTGSFYGFSTDASGANRIAGNTDTYIYRSTDSGVTWTLSTGTGITISRTWNGVTIGSDGSSLVTGNYTNGYTYRSTDSGTTWTEQGTVPPASGRWYGFASSSDGTKLITGNTNNGYIYTSTDSGVSWTQRTGPGTGYWYGFASDTTGTNIAVANYANGTIYKSTDSGATWASSAIAPVAPTLTSVTPSANSVTFTWTGATRAMSYAYTITPSVGTNVPTVSGATGTVVWSGLTASTSYTITLIPINAFGSAIPTGLSVIPYSPGTLPGTRPWLTCSGSSDGTKLVIGTFQNAGGVYTSTDSGITWTSRVGSGINANLQYYGTFSSSDGSILVTGTQGGNIYRSINYGLSWSSQTISPGTDKWFAFAGSSNGSTLVTGSYDTGFVYRSTDFGVTWTKAVTGLPASAYWYACASSSDGTKLIIGDNNANVGGYLYTSTDSGLTWTQRTSFGTSRWYGIASSSDGTKLVTGKFGGYIFTSTDSGANWTQRGTTTPGTGSWNTFASSSDGTKLFTAKNAEYIYTSVDSGVTWTQRIGAGTGLWQGIASSSDGVNLAIGNNGSFIYTSCDSGVTWRAVNNIAPLAPQLSLSGTTSTSVTVAWIGAAGAMSYSYAISPNQGTNMATLTSGVASTGRGSVTFSGLTPSTSYTITITAVNTWGSLASTALVVSTTA